MNYKKSAQILKEIKKSDRILIGCHKSPDADSVGCVLSVYQVLNDFNKKVKIVCPDAISENLKFLPYSEKIVQINFEKFDFQNYDLFISLDTPSPNYLTGSDRVSLPQIPIIVIDHHHTNPKYGDINLIDALVSSASEVLYLVFQDWGASIKKDIATTLLTGIIGDTNVFRFPSVNLQTLDIARELINKGADKNEIIFNVFASVDIEKINFWGEILKFMKLEEDYNFAWSAIPFEIYRQHSKPFSAREGAATLFGGIIEDTDFSIIMVEEKKNFIVVGLRSRTDFDVSKIALSLGGGGHKAAAGAKIEGIKFDEAIKKVLQVARKFAKKNV